MTALFALTMGDPSGIGPWVVAEIWKSRDQLQIPAFCWFGDPKLMSGVVPTRLVASREEALICFGDAMPVVACECAVQPIPGKFIPENSKTCITSIEKAVSFVLDGKCDGIITSPISKSIFKETNLEFTGHTDFIASLCNASGFEVMMLANPELKVVLATVHIPLKDVATHLNPNSIINVALTTVISLKKDFGIRQPRLAISGLNPHAGENGMLGKEEESIIIPAINSLQKQGLDVKGPYAADTMFIPEMRETYDAALCMYHDQGLVPLKTLDMKRGVNITIGLPIVRTSPDHGTAYDKAALPGKESLASIQSTVEAIHYAARIAANRKRIGCA